MNKLETLIFRQNIEVYENTERYILEMFREESPDDRIGICSVTFNNKNKCLYIETWKIYDDTLRNCGIGKQMLKTIVSNIHSNIENVQYEWDGVNSYVLDWINKFYPALLWESKISTVRFYYLDAGTFIDYLNNVKSEIVVEANTILNMIFKGNIVDDHF